MPKYRVELPLVMYVTIAADNEAAAREEGNHLLARLNKWENITTLDDLPDYPDAEAVIYPNMDASPDTFGVFEE